MKVLLVNGSGHAKGCTYTALEEVAGALEKNGIETEIIQVGTQPIAGCIGCNACLKNGACIVSCRRGGASAAFDQLNKYFTINCMPVVSSQYWNQVHGNTPEEVKQDLEGMQTMRTLGNNMAWLLKCIAAGKAAGVDFPEREPAQKTNFIR